MIVPVPHVSAAARHQADRWRGFFARLSPGYTNDSSSRNAACQRSLGTAKPALRSLTKSLLAVLLASQLTALSIGSALAEPPAMSTTVGAGDAAGGVPLVGAFERLARHEIDSTLAGRLLISELSCTACHATQDAALQPKRGPDLTAAGNRLHSEWMQAFIANPSAVKPGTTMPDVLHNRSPQDRTQIAAALSAYLGSLHQPLAEIKGTGVHPVPHQFWTFGDSDHGRTLYHRIGCVACHGGDPQQETVDRPASQTDQLLELLEPEELEELGLASAARSAPVQQLEQLVAKYSLRSLTLFLLDPEATRPGGRMPNFKLSAVDAADIAAYLMRRTSGREATADFASATPSPSELASNPRVAEGRQWFVQLRCTNCHQAGGDIAAPTARPLNQLDPRALRGCLAVGASAGDRTSPLSVTPPHFGLDADQVDAIAAALAEGASSDDTSSEAQRHLELKLLQFDCYACHQRDGLGGVSRDQRVYFETAAGEDLGDEGRLPPPLTGIGRKATPAWLNRVLQGNGEIRPHMHARMPKFPAAATKQVAALLLEVDRAPSTAESENGPPSATASWPTAADEQQVEVGRSMMDAGCVQCHSFRGESLPGVVGVDLSGIAERVEPQWFHEFLLNPGAVKARTRMPSFFPDGKSQNVELLGGDADRQIAAMWGYLKTLSQQPLPAKIAEVRAQDFELKPIDRPILLRTFMRQAGTHAIAVGYREQVHFAWDAESLRLASAWRGRFLDAQGTWFVRAAPPADPLGEDLVTFGDRDLLLFEPADTEPADTPQPPRHFLGFTLDEHGIPTFAYRVGDVEVEDRITPLVSGDSAASSGLRRVLRFRVVPPSGHTANADLPIAIRLLSGRQLTPLGDRSAKNEQGLVVTLAEPTAAQASYRHDAGVSVWVLPLRPMLPNVGGKRDVGSKSASDLDSGSKREPPEDEQSKEDGVMQLEVQYRW